MGTRHARPLISGLILPSAKPWWFGPLPSYPRLQLPPTPAVIVARLAHIADLDANLSSESTFSGAETRVTAPQRWDNGAQKSAATGVNQYVGYVTAAHLHAITFSLPAFITPQSVISKVIRKAGW